MKHVYLLAVTCTLLSMISCSQGEHSFPKLNQKGKIAVVAHQGFWNCEAAGKAVNSVASLKAAQDMGFWGSEFDVHITVDDVVLVFHDDTIDGVRIDTTVSATFADHRLKNGEPVPTLEDFLVQARKCKTTRMVLEFKQEITPEREDALIDKTVEMLKEYGLFSPKRVLFISFSQHVCRRLAADYPEFVNQYLTGDLSPEALAADGINGLDYYQSFILNDTSIVARCRDLGMSVNVWTVNDPAVMQTMIGLGVDAITTNEPEVLRGLLGKKEFRR